MPLAPRLLLLALVLSASAASARAQSHLHTLQAPAPQTYGGYGHSVAGVPDVDGDGRGDLLIGAHGDDVDTTLDAGRAYLVSGATGALLRTLQAPVPQAGARFGFAVSGVPDVDGDGRGDLLVGAFRESHGGNLEAGRAYLFSGATGALLRTLQAPAAQSRANFGISVSGVPDVNGDGRGDLLVGAAYEDYYTTTSEGRAYLYSGTTGGLLQVLYSRMPQAEGLFGDAVSGVPDVNGDGRGDLLVGASSEDHSGARNAGRAYLFSGVSGALLHTLQAPAPTDIASFGTDVSGVDDVDGDGRGDLLVGAPYESHGGTLQAGRAYLVSGATGALLHTLQAPVPRAGGSFGFAVSGVPDVDGDGRGDLLVGAYRENHGGTLQAGRAHLFSGATGAFLRTLQAPVPQAYASFGFAVSGVPDVDGDGRGDLLVGASVEDHSGATNAGRAYLFGGPDAALTITGASGTGNDAGWRMLAAPVVNAARYMLEDDAAITASSDSPLMLWRSDRWVHGGVGTTFPSGTGFLLYLFDNARHPVTPSGRTIDMPGVRPGWDVHVYDLPAAQRWHLLGNPFPESFDLDHLNIGEETGFQRTAQVWDPATGSYVLFTQGTGNDVIAPWQGFFVERAPSGVANSSSLVFGMEGRTTGGAFIGSGASTPPPAPTAPVALKAAEESEVRQRLLSLRLTGRDASGVTVVQDEAATLLFHEEAQTGWDALDASKLMPPDSGRYALLSLTGEQSGRAMEQAQVSVPLDPAGRLRVPLGLKTAGFSGELTLDWPRFANIPEGWRITLRDAVTNQEVDLQRDVRHRFTVNGDVSDDARFVLFVEPGAATGSEHDVPSDVELSGNAPNPFRTRTVIRYALPQSSLVRLAVYDVLGREVAVLVDGMVAAGRHEAAWRATGLPPGIYLYRLEAGGTVHTGRMTLAR